MILLQLHIVRFELGLNTLFMGFHLSLSMIFTDFLHICCPQNVIVLSSCHHTVIANRKAIDTFFEKIHS